MSMTKLYAAGITVLAIAIALFSWRGQSGTGESQSFAPMLRRVLPAVVTIKVKATKKKPVPLALITSDGQIGAPVPEDQVLETTEAGGSGSIIDAKRGLIYTNQHVVTNALEVIVRLSDGHEVPGKVLGSDIGTDVAVVQIEPKNLTAIPFGNSDKLNVGDIIVVAGSPYGLAGTAKMGMISAMMRTDVAPEIFENFIQIDSILNPGNSGGAMVNPRGELVGVVAASIGAAGESGIGFIIPINMARSIADQIVANGRVQRGGLGFFPRALTPEYVQKNKLPFAQGALIAAIAPKSPAAMSGFKVGDIVVGINHRPVSNSSDYAARIASIPIGKPVELDIYSNGKMRSVKLVIADLDETPIPMAAPEEARALAGLSLSLILPGSADYGKLRGVRVLAVKHDSAADQLGLAPDDIITKIDGKPVASPEEVFAMAEEKTGEFRIDVSRRGSPAYVEVTPTP